MSRLPSCSSVSALAKKLLFEDVIVRDRFGCNALMRAAIGDKGLPNFAVFEYLLEQRIQRYKFEEKVQGLELIGSNCVLLQQYEKGLSYLKRAAAFRFELRLVPEACLPHVSRRLVKSDWAGYKQLVNADAGRLTSDQKLQLIYQAVLIQLAWRKTLNVDIGALVETVARIANGGRFDSYPGSLHQSVDLDRNGCLVLKNVYCPSPVMDQFYFNLETDAYFKLLLLLFESDLSNSIAIDAPLRVENNASRSVTYLTCEVMEDAVFYVKRENRNDVESFDNCMALLEWLVWSIEKKTVASLPDQVIDSAMDSILELIILISNMQLKEKESEFGHCLRNVVALKLRNSSGLNLLQMTNNMQQLNAYKQILHYESLF